MNLILTFKINVYKIYNTCNYMHMHTHIYKYVSTFKINVYKIYNTCNYMHMHTHIYKYVSSILITFLLQFVECFYNPDIQIIFKSYSHQCNLIENVSELSNHYSTVFGINFRSPLESLSYFSVADGSLIPDIMHCN